MNKDFACPQMSVALVAIPQQAPSSGSAVAQQVRPEPPAHHARRIPVTVYGINEPTPGSRWKALFDATWPAYRAWYLSEGEAARPDLATATAQLARHMPELMPTYRRLVELAGGDDVAARMLTMWNAPGLPAGLLAGGRSPAPTPALCRNYDYSPDLWEQHHLLQRLHRPPGDRHR